MGIKDLLEAIGGEKAKAIPRKIIVNNVEFLSKPCTPATFTEAEEIWPILEASLIGVNGFGLTANQIGIQKAVGFIEFNGKTYKLLNPRIVESNLDKILFFNEGCLSFPGKTRDTLRHASIVIEDDNLGRLNLSLDKTVLILFLEVARL